MYTLFVSGTEHIDLQSASITINSAAKFNLAVLFKVEFLCKQIVLVIYISIFLIIISGATLIAVVFQNI